MNYDKIYMYATEHRLDYNELCTLVQEAIAPQPQPVAQPVHCQTCNDTGMIGGPSFYAPDEGGVPCPDCSQPDGMQPLEVLTSVWNAMQNSADGDDLLNKLEHMRDSIERAVQGDQQQALQELADDAQKLYGGYTAQPVQAQPSEAEKLMGAAGLCRRCAAPLHEQLPPDYMLAKLQMVMPLFQEARDVMPAISVVAMKLHGISPTLADRMDAAGTFSLADWEIAQPKPANQQKE